MIEATAIGEVGPCPSCESENLEMDGQDVICQECGFEKYVSAWWLLSEG